MPDYTLVPLTQGKFAVVDACDAQRVLAFKWTATLGRRRKDGDRWYALRKVWDGKRQHTVYLHRFIANAEPGIEVDHKNRDGLDCRRSNLREATRAQNSVNRSYERTCGRFRGVYPARAAKDGPRWLVQITANNKQYGAGKVFRDEESAARAYDGLARELHGEFAVLNFPEEVHP